MTAGKGGVAHGPIVRDMLVKAHEEQRQQLEEHLANREAELAQRSEGGTKTGRFKGKRQKPLKRHGSAQRLQDGTDGAT